MTDITAGTRLRVIPRIIEDNGNTRVRLEVDVEDGSLNKDPGTSSSRGGSGNDGAGTNAAGVTRSTISTQAIIDAQQTLMIGGYRAESLTRNSQKVPLLGDLPVLGGLFRSESRSNSTRERLFLITPRITGFDGTRLASNQADRRSPGMPASPVPGPGEGVQVLPAPAVAATASGVPSAILPLPRSAGAAQSTTLRPKLRCAKPPGA